MNRHERRKAAAADRGRADRQRTIAAAVEMLAQAAATDNTVSGCTLIRPDGEIIYLPAPPPSQVPQ